MQFWYLAPALTVVNQLMRAQIHGNGVIDELIYTPGFETGPWADRGRRQ
jgi:hypothetical protein